MRTGITRPGLSASWADPEAHSASKRRQAAALQIAVDQAEPNPGNTGSVLWVYVERCDLDAMKNFTYILIALLLVLHQDFWLWDSQTIVFGFLPMGLAYHLVFSLLSALVWAMALKTIWPTQWERWADEGSEG